MVTQSVPLPVFIAQCLEFISLEGRSGVPILTVFDTLETTNDIAYRNYAWNTLRQMTAMKRLEFYSTQYIDKNEGNSNISHCKTLMDQKNGKKKLKTNENIDLYSKESESTVKIENPTESKRISLKRNRDHTPVSAQNSPKKKRLKRKWPTTLAHDESTNKKELLEVATNDNFSHEYIENNRSRKRKRQVSQTSNNSSPKPYGMNVNDGKDIVKGKRFRDTQAVAATSSHFLSKNLLPDEEYVLGDPVDVSKMTFTILMSQYAPSGLIVVASEALRLKYLGVFDIVHIHPSSAQFDLLELIGRTRERGLDIAKVGKSKIFGKSYQKVHYLLDILLVMKLVTKTIVTNGAYRCNILHLSRYFKLFRPSMISKSAELEKKMYPKEILMWVIEQMLITRNERALVFADIGRELGYGKREQEKLRHYILHNASLDPNFPIELFTARCSTSAKNPGRKLWCVRRRLQNSHVNALGIPNRSKYTIGPTIELGIMQQLHMAICARGVKGATIPEIRDDLGVPTFKLPYKLVQILITNYKDIVVEQVVVAKSTMYRMFERNAYEKKKTVCIGEFSNNGCGLEASSENTQLIEHHKKQQIVKTSNQNLQNSEGGSDASSIRSSNATAQATTLKDATRGMLVSTTATRRKAFIMDLLREEDITTVPQLRLKIMAVERANKNFINLGEFKENSLHTRKDCGMIDTRSILRILSDLEAENEIVSFDISIPAKKSLNIHHRMIKCIALPSIEGKREVIQAFVDDYILQQQQKLIESSVHDDLNFIVTSKSKRSQKSRKVLGTQDCKQEIVRYSAESYTVARGKLIKLLQQNRRLGYFYGKMCRVKTFHLYLWRQGMQYEDCDKYETYNSDSQDITFVLKDLLDQLTIQEYIQLVGISKLLNEEEEAVVHVAINKGLHWKDEMNSGMSASIQKKIRYGESERFGKLLRVLIELNLANLVEDKNHTLLLKCFENQIPDHLDNLDGILSKYTSATLSGGLLCLRHDAHIILQFADTNKAGRNARKRKRPDAKSIIPINTVQYVYAANFACSIDRGDFATRKMPVYFNFRESAENGDSRFNVITEYWKVLKHLSVYGGSIDTHDIASSRFDLNKGEITHHRVSVCSKVLEECHIHSKKFWVPHASEVGRRKDLKSQPASDILVQTKQNFSANNVLQVGEIHKTSLYENCSKESCASSTNLIPVRRSQGYTSKQQILHSHPRSRLGNNFPLESGSHYTNNQHTAVQIEDMGLIDIYINHLTSTWFIDVPLALRKIESPMHHSNAAIENFERIAFRNTRLSRTKVSWKSVAEEWKRQCQAIDKENQSHGKKSKYNPKDVNFRIRELFTIPLVKCRIERTKKIVTEIKNPFGGLFHEEVDVQKNPRLSALLIKSLQILFHDSTNYSSVMAEKFLSCWTEQDVKTVWRYLWLAGLITRTRNLLIDNIDGSKIHRKRGFCVHSQVFAMNQKYLSNFSMQFFNDAGKYYTFIQEELSMIIESIDNDGKYIINNDIDCDDVTIHYEIGYNEHPGNVAVYMSMLVDGRCNLYPSISTDSLPSTPQQMTILNHQGKTTSLKGFAGHLAQSLANAFKKKGHPLTQSDIYRDNWSANVKFLSVVQSNDQTNHLNTLEAFSTTQRHTESPTLHGHTDPSIEIVQKCRLMLGLKRELGVSIEELQAQFQQNSFTIDRNTIFIALWYLVSTQEAIEVNGYDHVRYVGKSFIDIWSLHPYRVDMNVNPSNTSSMELPAQTISSKYQFIVDNDTTLVARPWLNLDGSINFRILTDIKRKLVNLIICYPGITTIKLYHKMLKLMGLQDLKLILEILVREDVIYTRLGLMNRKSKAKSNLFSQNSKSLPYSVLKLGVRDIRYVNERIQSRTDKKTGKYQKVQEVLHYFPTPYCIQQFGRAEIDNDYSN